MTQKTIVMKFGGTSVGNAQCMRQVAELVLKTQKKGLKPVLVLSAMSGVTNALIDGAQKSLIHDLESALADISKLKSQHLMVVDELISDPKAKLTIQDEISCRLAELEILYKGISYLGELTKRSLDAVAGVGELLCSRIMAQLLNETGLGCQWLDARKFIITDDTFGKANPLWEQLIPLTQSMVGLPIENGDIAVTQGFIGATASGVSTTLGRGGSDFTASIIGVALGAVEIQIWTDVDGMMTADPRVISQARVLPEVSFQEASELAYFGAKVLHPLTIKPAIEKNISVRILNTLDPDKPGTLIKSQVERSARVTAIASKKGISAIFISSPKMLMSHGFLAHVFAIFDKYKTAIDLIATSEISVSLTIDQTEHLSDLVQELSKHGEVSVISDVAIICVVGGQFRKQKGIAGDVFKALDDINILMISGGASDINLSFVVTNDDADKAVRQLHGAFFNELYAHRA